MHNPSQSDAPRLNTREWVSYNIKCQYNCVEACMMSKSTCVYRYQQSHKNISRYGHDQIISRGENLP